MLRHYFGVSFPRVKNSQCVSFQLCSYNHRS